MNICDYGCGQKAQHQFKNGKWCCSKSSNQCPVVKKNNSEKNRGRILEKFEKLDFVDLNILCDNGCGKVAKYITKNGKKYCEDNHTKCLVNRKKNSIGLTGNIRPKGIQSKLFGRKFPERSELMKKQNLMFVDEYKEKHREIVASKEYKDQMSLKQKQLHIDRPELKFVHSQNALARWESKEFREKYNFIMVEKGLWIPNERINDYKKYKKVVMIYTKHSLKKYGKKINQENLPIGIGEEYYNIDHIFSIIEGFKQDVNPKLIGNYNNLQVILSKENCSKKGRCDITLEELKKRANYI